MSDLDGLRAAFAAIPTNRLLGMELVRAGADGAEVALRLRPELVQEQGVVHGGILATLADTAAVYLTLPTLAPDERMASIEFKVNFLAPAWGDGPEAAPIRAVARPLKAGRRVVVCEARVLQGERLVLAGTFTYMRFRRGEG
jgi:acyl-CoA thioesterase